MKTVEILNIIKRKKIDYQSLVKELNIVTPSKEIELKNILSDLVDSGTLGLIESKYFIMPSDIVLAKVINKKRNSVTLKQVNSDNIIEISGDEIRMLLIGDLLYLRYVIGKYHPLEYLKPVSSLKGKYSLSSNGSNKLIVDYLEKCGIDVIIDDLNGYKVHEGDLLDCNITRYSKGVFFVQVNSLLVKASEFDSDIKMLIASKDIPLNFPIDVEKEIKNIPTTLLENDYIGRLDLRKEIIFTIDGVDSKDFDDAISIKASNNGYEIGVHIADVTSYVKDNHPLNNEAIKRGTSIYLADRVIPMLPLVLSNGICSLNPKVDRLTLSVFMNVDAQGNIFNTRIYKSVINSYARLNYDEVNDFYLKKKTFKDKKISDSLEMLFNASKLIRKRRKRNGSIDIETNELKFVLDEKGIPVDVKKVVTGFGENMIEDLMVSANVEVSKKLKENNIPVLYRVHEYPSKEKYELFKALIKKMDYTLFLKLPKYENITGTKLNDFILSISSENQKTIYSYLLLRAMSKAHYSSQEIGHFGLAENYYCHFTSPIRRYPDIIIHNLVKDYLLDKKTFDYNYLKSYLDKMAITTSDLEVRADQLEREVDDLLSCKYMSKYIGKLFSGKIVSFIKKGIFIELDNGIEGFLPFYLSNFESLSYQLVKDTLISFKTKDKTYSFGSKIDVVPLSVNLSRKEITFTTKSFFDKYAFNLSQIERDYLVLSGINLKDISRDFDIKNDKKKKKFVYNKKNIKAKNNHERKRYSRKTYRSK